MLRHLDHHGALWMIPSQLNMSCAVRVMVRATRLVPLYGVPATRCRPAMACRMVGPVGSRLLVMRVAAPILYPEPLCWGAGSDLTGSQVCAHERLSTTRSWVERWQRLAPSIIAGNNARRTNKQTLLGRGNRGRVLAGRCGCGHSAVSRLELWLSLCAWRSDDSRQACPVLCTLGFLLMACQRP